jgi:3-hydroxyisobutyrate dehydrogenase-like beta-hydroxyacid dehydrogenase
MVLRGMNFFTNCINMIIMAKQSKSAQKKVKKVMHEYKRGTLKSGKGGKGGTVKSRKQAIAIGLSEARESGAKVPPPPKK